MNEHQDEHQDDEPDPVRPEIPEAVPAPEEPPFTTEPQEPIPDE